LGAENGSVRRAKITSDETNETIRDITLKNLPPIPIITNATPMPNASKLAKF
jgi:hypothetical protein